MRYRALTEKEKDYLEQGGRVFLVTDENEIVILCKGKEPHFLANHSTKEVYKLSSLAFALEHAWTIARLSTDTPMVEGIVSAQFVDRPLERLRA